MSVEASVCEYCVNYGHSLVEYREESGIVGYALKPLCTIGNQVRVKRKRDYHNCPDYSREPGADDDK